MAAPDFQSFFKPLLEISADGHEHSLKEARDKIAKALALSPDDLAELLPSGMQTKYENRIAWAKSYLIQAGVFEPTRRGHFRITERGRDLLKQNHKRIDVKVLNQFPEFVEFHTTAKPENSSEDSEPVPSSVETPEEVLQRAHKSIRNELAGDLLRRVKANSSEFFEGLIVDLMIAMGYGGSRAEAGRSIGRSGDEGIDGIINEDRLGLDVVYLQAKRWEGTVGRPEIQKFVGALHGKRARKGVFITTGKFSDDAMEYVSNIEPRVILIDGSALANFMIDFGIGVTPVTKYEIKRVDADYFDED